MADTPSQNFGPLPDTLTFGPFSADGELTVHVENLLLGCPPFVQNIGVPFVCDGDETAKVIANGSYIEFQNWTDTGYYTVRASDGTLTTYDLADYYDADAGTYCMWPSDEDGNKAGAFTYVGLLSNNTSGPNDTIDLSSIPHLPSLRLGGMLISTLDISSNTEMTDLIIDPGLSISSMNLTTNTALVNVALQVDTLLSVTLSTLPDCVQFSALGCGLTQESVDNILVALAANGLAVTVDVSGGTNAAPSATGLAAKSTIISNGGNVTNN